MQSLLNICNFIHFFPSLVFLCLSTASHYSQWVSVINLSICMCKRLLRKILAYSICKIISAGSISLDGTFNILITYCKGTKERFIWRVKTPKYWGRYLIRIPLDLIARPINVLLFISHPPFVQTIFILSFICKIINFMSVRRAVDVRYTVRHKFVFSTYLQLYRATISERYKIGQHNDVHVQNWLFGTGERCSQRLFSKVFSSEPRVSRQATSRAWAETQNQERPRPSLE